MNQVRTRRKAALAFLLTLVCLCMDAQGLSSGDIQWRYANSPRQGRIVVSSVKNLADMDVIVTFINEYSGTSRDYSLGKGESRNIDITCNMVRVRPAGGGKAVYLYRNPKPAEKAEPSLPEARQEEDGKPEPESARKEEPVKVTAKSDAKETPLPDPKPLRSYKKRSFTLDEVVGDFNSYIDGIPYYSISAIEEERAKIEEHVNNLDHWKDKDGYIAENHLGSYLNAGRDSLKRHSDNTAMLITGYLMRFGNSDMADREACVDSLQSIVTERLRLREENLDCLAGGMGNGGILSAPALHNWKVMGICVGIGILLLLLTFVLVRLGRRKQKKVWTGSTANGPSAASSGQPSAIIVRRKTTSILRKQSLEDVIGNDAYLQIDGKDFCDDSAVRRIYLKNTCVKDIYNMYAEDLRNPNNPKEDGCMVLGRWVQDADTDEYYVSLEHIVRPGDDAVFSEYELNFGGKIKLKVSEKLRKLRRETNLQYDLTCWVHSHPGLGVFFSNSDNSVQMQLKSPSHPKFLTAMVVDILTPNQELGIFTFKRDGTMNSKGDLKKLYSLEEMYKWAVESERHSFKPEDHYNTLASAASHLDTCYGVELSNGAVIDMGMLATEQHADFLGKVYGYVSTRGLRSELVVTAVSKEDAMPGNDLVGCFVIATHCSIPSIRKAIGVGMEKVKFVLVYTTTDGLLTTIPVAGNDLCVDEKCYGEQKLEDLKIWTRRKR